MQPTDVEVAEGEMAVLTCSPPVGHPEPNVVWKKDGLPISSADHHYTVSCLPLINLLQLYNLCKIDSYNCLKWNFTTINKCIGHRHMMFPLKNLHSDL